MEDQSIAVLSTMQKPPVQESKDGSRPQTSNTKGVHNRKSMLRRSLRLMKEYELIQVGILQMQIGGESKA
jgi:hypothetical protein